MLRAEEEGWKEGRGEEVFLCGPEETDVCSVGRPVLRCCQVGYVV